MVFLLALLLIIVFTGASYSSINEFNSNYLDKKTTTSINGIFVILIVFSHYTQYADFQGVYDVPYLVLREHLNQMVVAPFLFYSGFGMMESIRKKGDDYVNKIPSKFWKLLLRFDVAVALFLILNTSLDIRYPLKQTLFAFTTWTSIGNSNWYITAILLLYIFIYVSFKASKAIPIVRTNLAGIMLTILMAAGCVYFQMKIKRPDYCYNTMILLPVGMLWSEFRLSIEKKIMRDDTIYFLLLSAMAGVYIVSFLNRWNYGIEGYTIWALSFTAILLLVTMKVRINNGLLEWLGNHVFSIYILQRLPMILLHHFGCIADHRYISLIAVFAITIPLALLFEQTTNIMIGALSLKKGK